MDTEIKHSWSWFIRYLIDDLNMATGEDLTVMSEMQKELVPVLMELYYQMLREECVLDRFGVIDMCTGKEKKVVLEMSKVQL